MSQENFNKNEKFPRFQPNRDENNSGPKKSGPKFSSYWIWAILLATVIGFSMFGPFAKKDPNYFGGRF